MHSFVTLPLKSVQQYVSQQYVTDAANGIPIKTLASLEK